MINDKKIKNKASNNISLGVGQSLVGEAISEQGLRHGLPHLIGVKPIDIIKDTPNKFKNIKPQISTNWKKATLKNKFLGSSILGTGVLLGETISWKGYRNILGGIKNKISTKNNNSLIKIKK